MTETENERLDAQVLRRITSYNVCYTKLLRVTARQADELAAQLSNPLYDPHGDPIPTADGEIPSLQGIPLNEAEIGSVVKVLHIEDEPPESYSQIISADIHPSDEMIVLEKAPDSYNFV